MFHGIGITPQFFEMIKFSGFGKHDMDDYIDIVNQNPLFGLTTFVFERKFFTILLYQVLHIIGNGFQLVRIGSFTDDKKIGNGFRDFPEIEADDVVTFFFLYGCDDRFEDLAVSVEPGNTFLSAV